MGEDLTANTSAHAVEAALPANNADAPFLMSLPPSEKCHKGTAVAISNLRKMWTCLCATMTRGQHVCTTRSAYCGGPGEAYLMLLIAFTS